MWLLLGVALVSAAGLAFQVTLTRLFAISQGYHFGFLAVSLALLGFGASGTALALRPSVTQDDGATTMRRLTRLSFFFSLTLPASYLAINYLPFDSYRVAWEAIQLLWLMLYYLALVVPFFVGGLVLGLPLAAFRAQTARVYAANLVGSGIGCIAALGALAALGTTGAVIFAAMLAAFGACVFLLNGSRNLVPPTTTLAPPARAGVVPEAERSGRAGVNADPCTARKGRCEHREKELSAFVRVAVAHFTTVSPRPIFLASITLVVVLCVLLLAPPSLLDLQISPYKGLSQILRFPDAHIVWSAHNAFSQIQVVESAAVRSAPGLSLAYRGAMPTQRALFVDTESIAPLTDAAPSELLDALPVTLAYRLRPNARALILKPGGGIEVLAALNAGARAIVAVEDNPLVADAARRFAPRAVADPRIRFIAEGTRSFVARSRETFDIVQIALSDPFRPVTAGAYALGENYIYTTEAFRDYLDHLNDDGILIVSRWLQLPPTEEARVGAMAISALEGDGQRSADSERKILALRSFSTLLLLVKRTPFTPREIEMARAFAEERQFDWVAYPGMQADEANRFNVLRDDEYARVFQQLLDRERRAQFFATYAYDIAPPTDDRPFFFHFFKWEQTPQVLQLLGKLWQPFGGSGYLILLALLALSVVASGVLIGLPIVLLRRAPPLTPPLRGSARDARWLIYFACLGIGFLFVEMPLIQRFILFLDQPVYALATVLFTLLIASGIGSALSERLPHRAMLALLIIVILAYPLLLPFLFQFFLGYPFAMRVVVAFILLAPMGFLMGIPFPKGLARLGETAPSLIPLAWGVNGCAAVISSILATMGAMSFGFSVVMLAGAGAYAAALIATEGTRKKKPLGSTCPGGNVAVEVLHSHARVCDLCGKGVISRASAERTARP